MVAGGGWGITWSLQAIGLEHTVQQKPEENFPQPGRGQALTSDLHTDAVTRSFSGTSNKPRFKRDPELQVYSRLVSLKGQHYSGLYLL